MRFLTPAQVVNGKLCDRGLYPLALRGVDYTPVSEEQTVRDLFRFRHDGINLIRLNIDDSVLSGPDGHLTDCSLYDHAVETIYRHGMYLYLVPVTKGNLRPFSPEAITRQQHYMGDLCTHVNLLSGRTLPEYDNIVCIETLFDMNCFTDEQFGLYVSRVMHQVYIEHHFSGMVPRVYSMERGGLSARRKELLLWFGASILTENYFQKPAYPIQCEPFLPGIPDSAITARIRPEDGSEWFHIAAGQASSAAIHPHRNGGMEAFLSYAADVPCVLHLEFPAKVFAAKFRPLLKEALPVTVDGRCVELALPSPRYGALEINYGMEDAPAYTVYILGDRIMPAPDLSHARFIAPGHHKPAELVCGDADTLCFLPGLHEIEGRLLYMESHKTVWLPRGAVVRAGLRAEQLEHAAILGQGILDGSRNLRDAGENKGSRMGEKWIADAGHEGCICFHKGHDLLYDGPLLYNPQFWNFVISGVSDCTIRNYKTVSWILNNDGIQPRSCRNLRVEHCFLKCNDDCVAVKTRRSFDMISGNLLFRDLVLWNDRAGNAMEIGHTSQGDLLHDVRFEDIQVINCSGGVIHAYIIDHSTVERLSYENIYVEGTPGACDFGFIIAPSYYTTDKERGRIRGIHVKHYFSEHPHLPGIVKGFDAEHKVENLTFEDINFRLGTVKQYSADKLCWWENEFAENITVIKGN